MTNRGPGPAASPAERNADRGLDGLRGDDRGPIAGAGGLVPSEGRTPEFGALEASERGGGGLGQGQSAGAARQDQAFGTGAVGAPDAGSVTGGDEPRDPLRAQAEAQDSPDADDARNLLDKTRAAVDAGSVTNNSSL